MLKFFSAAAFEQRARDRERRALVAELERQPYVEARLAALNRADSVAMIGARGRPAAVSAPVHLVHATCRVAS